MNGANGSAPIIYTPYQQALIEQLLKEAGPGNAHRLVAPVGAGKSFGIAGAVTALVKAGQVSRVLVLSPAMLEAQWTQLLENCGAETIMLDGRSIRVMRNEFVHGVNWPEGVFTMSIDLARRDDVYKWVSELPWDFVVIDEAHRLSGQRWRLVQTLLAKPSPPGLLLSTAISDVDTYHSLAEVVEIDWREAVKNFQEEQRYDSRDTDKLVTCTYRRTSDEIALVGGVMATAKQLEPLKGIHLLRRAASSVYSLEESLKHLVESAGPNAEDLQMLESLLDSVEGLQVDPKFDCLKALVGELSQAGIRHAVLFCEYRATLDYLRSAVQDLDLAHLVIHGGMTSEARSNTFSRFNEDGGFLITTAAASQFLSMNFVEAVIHYDLPLSSRAFAKRVGSYRRYVRSIACTAYCLEDETGVLPIEAIQLQIARVPDSDSIEVDEVDTDLHALFKRVLG